MTLRRRVIRAWISYFEHTEALRLALDSAHLLLSFPLWIPGPVTRPKISESPKTLLWPCMYSCRFPPTLVTPHQDHQF